MYYLSKKAIAERISLAQQHGIKVLLLEIGDDSLLVNNSSAVPP
jgi:hypothetical protein